MASRAGPVVVADMPDRVGCVGIAVAVGVMGSDSEVGAEWVLCVGIGD